VFFGNEREGVSDELLTAADARMVVPMAGFSKSFNISVAAALTLYHIRQDRIRRAGRHGDLSTGEQAILTAVYYLRSVEHAEAILCNE
jgi:tRNA (guanosine-2'-O-)-methyltransferase